MTFSVVMGLFGIIWHLHQFLSFFGKIEILSLLLYILKRAYITDAPVDAFTGIFPSRYPSMKMDSGPLAKTYRDL